MSFSSGARNDFAQRKRAAPDLIPVPRYGDLYQVGLFCGHAVFAAGYTDWMICPLCGVGDVVMVSVKVIRG